MTKNLLAALALSVLTLGVTTPANAAPPTKPLPSYAKPCKFEDSINCTWDAKHRGNGKGQSFTVNREGKVTYVSHKRAHTLVTRWREAHGDYTNV